MHWLRAEWYRRRREKEGQRRERVVMEETEQADQISHVSLLSSYVGVSLDNDPVVDE